ncbi:MAG TPA: transposase [Phycisphaerae bacterium]|nr:transposase [Phycisphaerae bacterium]
MLQPLVRRTLAPRGQTPILECWDRHDRFSVISALTLAPRRQRLGLYFEIYSHNIRTDDVYRFIQSIRGRLRRKIILVLDRWSVHRAAIRRLLERHARNIDIELLPAYAPELNPT